MDTRSAPPFVLAELPRFHRSVGLLAAAGALAGPVLAWLAPGPLGQALGLAAALALPTVLGRPGLLLVPPAVALAAVAAGLAGPGLPAWPLLAGVLLALPGLVAGALARPADLPSGRPARALVAAVAGAATLAGGLTAAAVAPVLAARLPPLVFAAATGALVGGYAGLGTLAAHLGPSAPPSLRHLRRLARTLAADDLKALTLRAADLHRGILGILGADPALAPALRTDLAEVAARIAGLAERCEAVDRDLGEEVEARLDGELSALAELAEGSEDGAAAARYRLARQTLAAQADQVRRLRAGRARAVASLHAQVAILERTWLSLVALRASDSGRLAGELASLSTILEDVTRDLEARSDAFLDLGIPEEGAAVV